MSRTRQYSTDEMVKAIKAKKGMVYLAAEKIGCSAETIYQRAKTDPEINETITSQRGKVVDTAEQKLITAINKSQPWAIQLALKTIGKDRGYVEKREVEHSGNPDRPVITEIVIEHHAPAPNGTTIVGDSEREAGTEIPSGPI